MLTYVVRRILLAVLTVWGVTTIVFALQRLPGDPTLLLVPPDIDEAARLALVRQFGLDRPALEQYGTFLWRTLQGDMGVSWRFNQPALGVVLEALPATLRLTFAALGLGILVAVPLGVAAAVKRDTAVDTLATGVAVIGQSMPIYWSGLIMILIFSAWLRWLPSMGADGLLALILPAVALGMNTMARIMRITRSAMLDVLGQDYIRTLRAKGVPSGTILFRHALRNAATPIVALIGLQLGTLLGGAVLVETVFAWPGIGRLAVNAVYARDFPVVQAVALVVTVAFSLVNMIVDILVAALNPQIRLD